MDGAKDGKLQFFWELRVHVQQSITKDKEYIKWNTGTREERDKCHGDRMLVGQK